MKDFARIEDLKSICLKCGLPFITGDQVSYGWHSHCFDAVFSTNPSDKFTKLSRVSSTTLAGSLDDIADSSRSTKFHGHFPKYTMSIGGKSYIAKIGSSSGGYEGLALAEKVCNDIGASLGLPIAPNFHLIWFKDRPCFLVRNFMESLEGDLVHLVNFWPRSKTGEIEPYYIETLFTVVTEKISYGALKIMIFVIIYDFLIGNGDRHRQNFGFIRSAKGMALAPIYDNVSDLGLEKEDFLDPSDKMHPGMKIIYKNQNNGEIYGYLQALVQLGFHREVSKIVAKIGSKKSKILRQIDQSFVTKNLKNCLYEIVERRATEIEEAWSKLK